MNKTRIENSLTASQEIFQESRRVFRRLGGKGAFARQTASGQAGVFVPRNRWARPVLTFEKRWLCIFLARDFIRPVSGGVAPELPAGEKMFVLSETGRALLVRELGESRPTFANIKDREGRSVQVTVNVHESPLAWLQSRRDKDGNPYLSKAQCEAGERLRQDFSRGHLSASVTADWSLMAMGAERRRRAPVPGLREGENALHSRQRYWKALEATGPVLAHMLNEVCCQLTGLEAAEKKLDLPKRSGKVVLRIALQRLACHYGLETSRVVIRE